MSQDLFEDVEKQYSLYRITAFTQESQVLGDPEEFTDGEPTAAQAEFMEGMLAENEGKALTYDESFGLWIAGAEEDIARMFADRDEFVDALENGEDPGVV